MLQYILEMNRLSVTVFAFMNYFWKNSVKLINFILRVILACTFFKLSGPLSHCVLKSLMCILIFYSIFSQTCLQFNLWDNEISWNIRLSNSQGFLQIVQNIFSENCSGSNSSQYPPAQWAPWWFIKNSWNEMNWFHRFLKIFSN